MRALGMVLVSFVIAPARASMMSVASSYCKRSSVMSYDVRLQSSFILCVEQASKQGTCVRQIRGWQMEAYNEARTLCVDFR